LRPVVHALIFISQHIISKSQRGGSGAHPDLPVFSNSSEHTSGAQREGSVVLLIDESKRKRFFFFIH
jgi:hypothetical protein